VRTSDDNDRLLKEALLAAWGVPFYNDVPNERCRDLFKKTDGLTLARVHGAKRWQNAPPALDRTPNFPIVIYQHGDVVSEHLIKFGSWELTHPDQIAAMADATLPLPDRSPRPLFLDIGGNLGYYSLLFASIGYSVFTIEAMPSNAEAIERSLCLNPSFMKRVTLVNSALGTPKQKDLKCTIAGGYSGGGKGNGHLSCSENEPDPGLIQVPLTTLDELLAKHSVGNVDVVKMDVEGAECNVIEGGQSLFSRYQPKFLQFEARHGDGQELKCIQKAAIQGGFKHRVAARTGHDDNTVIAST
jgi:FkbM family methyltransferase